MVQNVYKVGKISRKIYSCISDDIATDEVIITSNRITHIENRRGKEFYKTYAPYFEEIISNPDYIFKDKQSNTALVCKRIEQENKYINIVLRIILQSECSDYKNSIITVIGENSKRFTQRLRNNSPLYIRDNVAMFDIKE